MNTITLYVDLQKIYDNPYDIIVRRVEDYVDAYHSILEAIYQQQSLIVVIQNKLCLHYFEQMQKHYPYYLTVKVSSPRQQFQEMSGTKLPEYITDEDIVNDQFNQKAKEIIFNPGLSFENIILDHYLGGYFTNERFPFSKLVDFLQKINLEPIEASRILGKVYNTRMNLWQENCHEDFEKNIVQAFLEDPSSLLSDVAKYSILKNYSDRLVHDITGDISKDLDKLKLKDNAFIPLGMDTTEILRNIRIHLNGINKSGLSHEEVHKEIESLTGLFSEELQFVYELLRENKGVLDSSILKVVRKKFKTGSQLDWMFEENLKKIIPPTEVTDPGNITNLDEWISWAITSYLPYKFWMEANDICDENVDKYSQMFGDWFFNHYDSIIADRRMLYKTIANLSSSLKSDELSFIVMIDNLNYKYVPLCKSHFNAHGFSTTIDQPLLAMIPTETSVSKTAFFSGQPFNTEEKSYENMCKEWSAFINEDVAYLSDIGKLDALQGKTAKIYILNYLSIDKSLHENQNNAALPISHRVQEELKAMMDRIVNFSKKLGLENKIKIYFVSDHGSTKIIKGQQNLIPPKYYKAKADDCAYRVLALQDNKFETYKDGISHLCYVLDRNSYGIKENYLIARGYNRFLETDSSFYVHGGISPEECIIPLLKFERINVDLVQPEMLLRNNEFRYSTTSSIHLTLKNYNSYSLDSIEITIINSNIRWEQGSLLLAKMEKESQVEVVLDRVRLIKSNSDKERLMIHLKFDFLGREFTKEYNFQLKIKSTQENKINFDEFF